MTEAGTVCSLITAENAGHSCDWPVSNPNFLPTLEKILQFLKSQHLVE